MQAAVQISVSPGQRVCINCNHYKRLLREVDIPRESYKALVPVSFGWCDRLEEQRNPLRKPCKDYETEEPSQAQKPLTRIQERS